MCMYIKDNIVQPKFGSAAPPYTFLNLCVAGCEAEIGETLDEDESQHLGKRVFYIYRHTCTYMYTCMTSFFVLQAAGRRLEKR